jgi:selT/selW/selH-like putative selenoprotein
MDDHQTTTTAAAAAVPPSSSSSSAAAAAPGPAPAPTLLPRVTIRFCTQCKWMLRAAYYAQELLSTFSTALGEVALQPSTGGTFVVDIVTAAASASASGSQPLPPHILWDRKTDGGFPETKELKRRVRDVIEPGRDLGHVDRNHAVEAREAAATTAAAAPSAAPAAGSDKAEAGGGGKEACEDCQA